MQRRKNQDLHDERTACEKERNKGTVTFPAIVISSEIEKNQDTTCIDTNRDEQTYTHSLSNDYESH